MTRATLDMKEVQRVRPLFLTFSFVHFHRFLRSLCPFIHTGCLTWHCRVEPKVGDRIPGRKYDSLMPKDIEPYLNGRSWEDLKIGDEIDFDSCTGEQKLPNCPGEHGLTPFLTTKIPTNYHEGYRCDACDGRVKSGLVMHGCRECDYIRLWSAGDCSMQHGIIIGKGSASETISFGHIVCDSCGTAEARGVCIIRE